MARKLRKVFKLNNFPSLGMKFITWTSYVRMLSLNMAKYKITRVLPQYFVYFLPWETSTNLNILFLTHNGSWMVIMIYIRVWLLCLHMFKTWINKNFFQNVRPSLPFLLTPTSHPFQFEKILDLRLVYNNIHV